MSKHYFLKVGIIPFLLLTWAITAKAQVVYALHEGFETGIPNTWTQEYVFGNTSWTVEQGGSYPSGSAEGSMRVVLRNNTQQTQNFVTKLVSPIMNLSKVYQPILIFSHAQEQQLGDVDQLQVYYRSSATTPWVLLKDYSNRIRSWAQDTIKLVGVTATYQIAFQGKDKFGRGVVLDNIRVRPMPICTQPTITVVAEAKANSFDLYWSGSFDADSFAVKISKTKLTDIELASDLALDTIVQSFSCSVKNLDVNTTYYCYVKSFCLGEESPWSDAYAHRTQASVVLPYTENFNMAYNAGVLNRISSWTWKNSWPDAQYNYSPHINTNIAVSSLGNYSRTGTTCVVFTGSNNSTTAIPAGQWAYISSPQIIVDSIQKVQVSFWGSAYTYLGSEYASSLIVGIMTDPEDIETFVPIDTVSINSTKTFEEFIIPFNSYTGNGKHIAFLSNFKDKTNLFYLDDVTIELIPDCQKITGVKALNVSPTSAVLKWNAAMAASAYKVIVTSEQITNVSQIDPTKVAFTTLSNTNSCQIPVNTLESWKKYYVYVQAACADDTGAWSNEYSFQTPCAGSLPMYYTFEPSHDGTYQNGSGGSTNVISNCLYAKSQHTVLPYNYNTPNHALQGTYSLWMIGFPDSKAYVSFPALDSLSNIRMSFFAKTSYASYVGSQSIIEIGVLSDINDYSSFVSLDTIVSQVDYNRYRVDFSKYKGNGKNIAIAVSSLNTGMAYVNVDNLLIEAIPECSDPDNVNVEPHETSARFTWDAIGAAYRLKIATVSIPDSILNTEKVSVVDTILTTNSCLVENLLPNKTKYYYYIQTLCDTIGSEWTYKKTFETLCLAKNSLPYKENFDSYSGGSSAKEIPTCWETKFTSYTYPSATSPSYFPSIATSPHYSGSRSLSLTSGTSQPLHADYVVLPGMNVDSVQQLQVSFMLSQSAVNYTLQVGVISDLSDTTTFVPVRTIKATNETKSIWQEITVPFDSYKGAKGYIMLRSPLGYNYIDDIVVDSIRSCFKPRNLKAKNIEANAATLYWDKGSNEAEWNLIVLTTNTVLPSEAPDSIVVFKAKISDNPHVLNGLKENTQYYYYLQSTCDATNTSWTINYGKFRTSCTPKTVGELSIETFEDGVTNFDCWETGVQTGTSAAPSRSTSLDSKRLYIFNTTSSNGTYAIMPPIVADSINRMKVTFTGFTTSTIATNKKSIIVGIITNSSDFASFTPIDTVEVEYTTANNHPKDYVVSFDTYKGDYNGDYGKRVIFMSSFGMENSTNYIYLDNVRLDTIAPCPEPTKVWADSIGTYAAHISWNGMTGMTYRVKVSKEPLSSALLNAAKENNSTSVVCDTTLTATGLGISKLDMLKTYYMYVQTICSATDSSDWSLERSFKTECPASYALPYKEDFDKYGTGTTIQPSCWNNYYGTATSPSSSIYPYINGSYNNSIGGVGGLYFYTPNTTGYYNMSVSPRLDVEDISKTQISFFARNNTSASYHYSRLIVGVTANPDSLMLDSFLPIDTICIPLDHPNDFVAGNWYKYKYDLSYLANDSLIKKYKHIVFTMDYSLNRSSSVATTTAAGYMAIDDVELALIPTCQKPDNLKIVNKTEASISVSWEDMFAPSSWNVQYGPKGFVLGTGTTISSDTTNSSISALSPNTTYDIYVQSNCGIEDGTSLWVGPLTVTTFAVPVTQFPYLQGFEDNTENSKWQFEQGTIVNQWNIGTSIAKTGNKSLYISNDNGLKPQYTITKASSGWAYRTLVLEPGMYTVSFDWNCYGESTLDYIRAGFLPATSIFTSATTAGTVKDADGTTTTMGATSTTTPKSWVGLEGNGLYKLNLIDTLGVDIKWSNAKSTIIITDEQAGYYNLVFYWRNNDNGGKKPNPSALIDNIIIEKVACPIPIQIKTDYVLDTLGQVSWSKLGADQTSWNIKVLNKELSVDALQNIPDSVVVLSTITDTTVYQIHGLQPQTPYFIYVSANCSDTTSFWIKHSFITACTPSVVNTLWTFEENNNHQTSTSASYLAPDCWAVGNKNSTSYNYIPFKIKDGSLTSLAGTATNTYSRSNGLGTALRIYSATAYNGAYAIMPAYDGDMDTLQLHFQARAAYAAKAITTGQGYKISTTYANSTYAHSIIVGTVTDQSDISTFVPLDTVILSTRTTSEYANEANNWLFDEIVIPLGKAKGKYVTLLSEFDKANYVYIDDISIEKVAGCFAPKNIIINSITSSTAQIKWDLNGEGGTAWVIKVAKDKDLNNVIVTDTTYSHSPYQINNLKPGTTYYVAVQQLCSAGEFSDWSVVNEFETARTLIYKENFDAFRHNPASWYRYNGKFITDEVLTSSLKNTAETVTGSTAGWVHNSGNNGLKGHHQYVSLYSTSSDEWLVSPTVEIPSEPTWLTFDLALTGYDIATPVIKNADGNDDRFIVAVSEDGGNTWNKPNTTEWNNANTGTYKFDSIANTGEKVKIDLSKYAGKDIRVAFYGESTAGKTAVSDRRADIHIDNVQINRYVLDTIQTSLCPTYDYIDNHFDITYDNLQTGVNEFSKLILSSNNSIADSLITLKVAVSPLAKKIIAATTCEGVEYTDFNFKSSLEGEYKQKLKLNSGNGCDSLVVLNLSVIPKIKVNVFDTICYGVPYVFNNIPYTRSGLYTATFQSKVTGCDSIVSLYLKVKDALRKELNETICYGESYTFGGKALNVSGTYTDTLQTSLGCDSIVTLKLIAKTQLSKKITDVVCKGNTYTGYGFVGVPAIAGDYTRIEKTADGCDSTIVLSLSVQDPETIIYRDTISVNELPYTFHGTTYPTGKAIGTYEVTTVDGFGGCKVIKAILTIQEETGLNNPFVYNLSVVPTIIQRGGSVQIMLDTEELTQGQLQIDVYNTIGVNVYSHKEVKKPIEINAFPSTGIYLIKLTTTTNKIMYGRVIVK